MAPFISILGGIILLLLGLRALRKGFARCMGGDLIDWLQSYTKTRGRAFCGGLLAGAVMPSSTAMAFLSVRLTREGKGPWPNILAILLGAQVGITVLVQILTLPLGDWAMLFLVFGGFLFLFVEQPVPRGGGQILLAFGFMLLGMSVIGESAREIAENPDMGNLFAALGAFPLLFALGAMALSLLLQSSTATIALGIGLSGGGEISPIMLYLWVLGTNIGLCLTVLAAGWSRYEGRLLGLAVLAIKLPLAVALGALLFIATDLDIAETMNIGSSAQQAAWLHTLFNLAACGGIFLANHLRTAIRSMIGENPPEEDRGTVLEPMLLQYPSLALNAVTREILGILQALPILLSRSVSGLREATISPLFAQEMAQRGEELNQCISHTADFLNQVADDEVDEGDRSLRDALDDLLRELPLMLRSATRDIPEEVIRLITLNKNDAGRYVSLIEESLKRYVNLLGMVSAMLMKENPEAGKEILRSKQVHSHWLTHSKRNTPELPQPARDLLDDFQQLIRRLASVAYVYRRSSKLDSDEPNYE